MAGKRVKENRTALRRIRIEVDSPREPPVVLADPGMLERVIANLLGNALRYTPPGGLISLRASHPIDGFVLVEVRDSGTGIAQDELPWIFDRAYQARSGGPGEAGLGGLGLAIVKRIVEAHGSTISIQSVPGLGTTFSFALRVADQEGTAAARRGPGHAG